MREAYPSIIKVMKKQIKELSDKIEFLITEIKGLKIQFLSLSLNQPTETVAYTDEPSMFCSHSNAYITTGGWYCPDCGCQFYSWNEFNERTIPKHNQSPA